MTRCQRFSIPVCSVWLSLHVFAQSPSQFEIGLKKNFVSWAWLANLSTAIKTGSASQVLFSNLFRSTLFEQTTDINFWRDENTLEIYWDQRINSKLETRSGLFSRIFSDENTSREFNKHLIAQEITINLHPKIRVKPALGWTVEKSFGNQDQTWYSKVGLQISKLDMGGYLNSTDINSEIRAFPGRKNQEHTFFTAWSKEFSQFASDSLRIGYQFSESRYYIPPTPTEETAPLEQAIINARFLFNQLQYRISASSFLALITNFRDRAIDQSIPSRERQNLRKELLLTNQMDYVHIAGRLIWKSGLVFAQTDRDNPGVDTDINTLQTTLNNSFLWQISPVDELLGRFSYTKFEYNTPESIANDDFREDRDELRLDINAGYRHHFSPYFAIRLTGNIFLYHQIYLRSRRSRNNNWNRIFQLAAGFEHRLSNNVEHRHQIKILANYTVFDFEEILTNVNSFVFRKLVYNDTLSIRLTPNLSLDNIYRGELEDNGRFLKNEFAQQVNRELTSHFLDISLRHRNIFGLTITSGIGLFYRDEWSLITEKIKVRKFRSLTPRVTVSYPAGRLLFFFTYAPNKASNATRAINATRNTPFQEVEQYYTSATLNLQYSF